MDIKNTLNSLKLLFTTEAGKQNLRLGLKHEGKYLIWDCIGSLLYGIGIYSFAAHASFAPGGITGAAMIINYLFKVLPIGSLTVLLNIPIILVSLRFLGLGYLLRTFQTLLMNAIFIDLILPALPHYTGNPLLAAIFSGSLSGLGLAILYNAGTCTGGSDLVIMTMRKLKPHLSIGQITMIIDGSIILIGIFVYKSIDAMLYGIIYTICSTMVIDKMMYGFVSGKVALIISENSQEVSAKILNQIHRGVTRIRGEGMYTRNEKNILMCACSKNQIPNIKKIVHECDEKALLIVLESNEVHGTGFLPHGH